MVAGSRGYGGWCAAVVAVVASLLLCGAARAATADFEAAVKGLEAASPDGVARAIEAIGATGDPRALPLLQAVARGDALVGASGRVYLRDGSAVRDAVTGAPAGGEPTRAPEVDNAVRRALDPLVARIELRSADPALRRSAVDEVAGHGGEDDVAALRGALAVETDRAVRRAIVSSLAELDLASPDPAKRLSALRAIESAGSVRLLSKVRAMTVRDADGSYAEPDARVRGAAAGALRSLERKQRVVDATADVLYGLSSGSILLLCALGLAITFGLMGVINMAHGEMLMVGAYATYVTQLFFRAHFPQHMSLYLVAAVPFAFVTSLAVGALLERTVIRFLYGRPLETLLATWGLSLLLIQTVRTVFSAQNVAVENPPWLAGGAELFDGVVIPYNRVAVVAFTVVVVAFVGYLLRGTSLGLRVRAVTQNRPMAACMGISTSRVDTWTFALGSAIGGLGGVALSQLGNVGPELGQGYIVDAFMVVVLGGVGKLTGCVFAAFILGILNKFLEPVAGAVLGKIVVLVLVVLIIQKRPQGLFAPRVRGSEAA